MNDDFRELTAEDMRGIGDNAPPTEIEALHQRLEDKSGALLERRDSLLSSVTRVPAVIEDEEVCGKVADLVKLIMACHKTAEAARIGEKEPFLTASRAVDGWYKQITDPLEKARRSLDQLLTAYQRRKAEEERRRREEEARRQAEEAERARREAEEAARKIETEQQLEEAISADTLARQADADAEAARKAAEAKPAELSRSRGEYGSVASLRTYWDFADLDRETLDLNALRPYFAIADLEKAVRLFIRAGGRQLSGCRIFENTTTTVR